MNDSSQPKQSRSTRFQHRLFSWRTLRLTLIGLAVLATAIAAFYTVENWRGQRAWNEYREQLEARGEQLDFRAFIPPPVPDEENFAATPALKSWFNIPPPESESGSIGKARNRIPKRPIHTTERQFVDLAAWRTTLEGIRAGETTDSTVVVSGNLDPESRAQAAPAVLDALKSDEALFSELRAASVRPYARFPVDYNLEDPWGIRLPHLAKLKTLCQNLELKTVAELATGQTEEAFDDLMLMFRVTDALRSEPILISFLVRSVCFQFALQPIWEGLAEKRWTETQLQQIQTRLQSFDFISDLARNLDSERAAGILAAELLARRKYRFDHLFQPEDWREQTFLNLMGRIMPRGWFHLEQVNYCKYFEMQQAGAFDSEKQRVFPRPLEAGQSKLEDERKDATHSNTVLLILRHHLLAELLLPSVRKVTQRAALAHSAADLAAVACALERYRLAHGNYPNTLDPLTPQWIKRLPHDVISGEPLRYRLTSDGSFILYSIGWNEKDDGGTIALNNSGKSINLKQGDWVWSYPPAAAPQPLN
jgi:hypothetical protein